LKAQSSPQSQPWKNNFPALTTFKWKGRDVLAKVTGNDELLLLNAEDHISQVPMPTRSGGLATWQDAAGARWIDTASPAGVKAFQVAGSEDQPTALLSWASRDLIAAGPPVVANGVLYFLSTVAQADHLTLHAFDAVNGKALYNSDNAIASHSSSGNIGLANGHICLSAADGTLYCFGLPFEM
jgi:outer membrane protein assembly factor BamB